jgi:hypothetical protein
MLTNVSKQMERLDRHVGANRCTLEAGSRSSQAHLCSRTSPAFHLGVVVTKHSSKSAAPINAGSGDDLGADPSKARNERYSRREALSDVRVHDAPQGKFIHPSN